MTKHRRGPKPDPDSKFRMALAKRANVEALVDQLATLIPFGSLPDLVMRADIEAKIPATVTDPATRRLVCTRFLRRAEFISLGGCPWHYAKRGAIWGRDCAAVRAMTSRERATALFGPPPRRPPPPQYAPCTVGDWRREYEVLHRHMVAFGFTGRPSQIWRGDWRGPKAPASAMVNDSTGSRPSSAIAQTTTIRPDMAGTPQNASTGSPESPEGISNNITQTAAV